MHLGTCNLTYMHADRGALIYSGDKHLFGAFYHVCMHVICVKD
jgi:hypothetical protein